MTDNTVTNINVTYNVALVTVDNLPGNLKIVPDILSLVSRQNINVDMISQAPPYRGSASISFTIPSDDLVNVISTLNGLKKNIKGLNIEVDADNTKLQVYGKGMKNVPGVAAKLFTVLAAEDIEIKLVTTSEVDISYLIYEKDVDRAISAIKTEFGLE